MADRLIEHTVSEHTRVEGVGRVRYVRSPDHEHWHFLGFMRYELRHAGKRAALARDRKTGFCLGDRYQASGAHLPAQPAAPVYTGRCGLGQTGRLHLVEGISVGYGDDYPAALEGQSLRLTGLPAGRYVLLHRVNVERRLRESSYRNNASSLLLGLRWRHAKPRLRVLASCPNSARCNDPQRRHRLGAAVEACRPAPPTEEARAMTDAPTTTGSTRRRTKVRRLQPRQPRASVAKTSTTRCSTSRSSAWTRSRARSAPSRKDQELERGPAQAAFRPTRRLG